MLFVDNFFVCAALLGCTALIAPPAIAEKTEERSDDATHLTEEDFARAQELTETDLYKRKSGISKAWVQTGNYLSDIRGKASSGRQSMQNRNGVRLTYDKWPNGQIAYIISKRYTNWERAILARALQVYHERTCLQFIPRTTERDYLYIGKIDGCFSDVGRAGGRQEVSLDDGCLEYDTAIHELMHAVGFWHEHERWDRDDYIQILWQNIEKDAYDQFGKVNLFESDYYGEKYDYLSIMHYDSKAFSKNNQNTIETRQTGFTPLVGHVKDFSEIDLRKINKMYNCRTAQFSQNSALPNTFASSSIISNQNNAANVRSPFPVVPAVQSAPFQQQPSQPQTSQFSVNGGRFENIVQPPPAQQLQQIQGFATQLPAPASSALDSLQLGNTRKCKDKATLCWRWVSRCRSPFFDQIMREFCAATCGFCYETAGLVVDNNWSSNWLRDSGRKR